MSIRSVLSEWKGNYQENKRKRKMVKKIGELHNKEVCLISSNCNGAMILHDLGLKFNSPFVNLWIPPKDYLRMLGALQKYMSYELVPCDEEDVSYPVGCLGDVKIYFQHYASFEEAKRKWDERKQRMDYEHLYILFSDRDGCTQEDLATFDQLPYAHKAVFVHVPHPEITSAVYIHGFENESCVGMCMYYTGKLSYRRYYDDFDYVAWLNQV